jgi:hypothetical protein
LHRVRGNRIRGSYYLKRNAIRFLLVLVISGTDSQFWLKTKNLPLWCEALRLNQLRDTLVAQHPLHFEDGMKYPLE